VRARTSVAIVVAFGMLGIRGAYSVAQEQELRLAESDAQRVARSVARLVEQIKKQTLKPATTVNHRNIYLIDLERGETTLVASLPQEGYDRCGSPVWSNDGSRILYDTMPGTSLRLTLMKSISAGESGVNVTDLGQGNCPSFSADGDRIIFLNNSRQSPRGIWIMQADGSNRRPLQGYGRTKWSPDGHRFLIISLDPPCTVTVIDDRPGKKSGPLEVPGKNTFLDPTWAGDGLIVAPIGESTADSIALVDVNNPEQAAVKEVLWTRGKDLDVEPSYPLYWSRTQRLVFVGMDRQMNQSLYLLERGKKTPPRRLEPGVQTNEIRDLAPSPDGRYLLFAGNREEKP
jgi:Tol biopolymer transport system component